MGQPGKEAVRALGSIFQGEDGLAWSFTNLHRFHWQRRSLPTKNRPAFLSVQAPYIGTAGSGAVRALAPAFAINTRWHGFYDDLHSFTGGDGARPAGDLALYRRTLCAGRLVRVAVRATGVGICLPLHLDGSAFTNLHHFTASQSFRPQQRWSCSRPGGLILSGNALLCGATARAVIQGVGPCSRSSGTNGAGLTTVHPFSEQRRDGSHCRVGSSRKHIVWDRRVRGQF